MRSPVSGAVFGVRLFLEMVQVLLRRGPLRTSDHSDTGFSPPDPEPGPRQSGSGSRTRDAPEPGPRQSGSGSRTRDESSGSEVVSVAAAPAPALGADGWK